MSHFTLPPLPYAYNELVPHIDARTMEIHYTKHHAGYVQKLNKTVQELDITVASIEELLRNIDQYPLPYRDSILNNGGGHYNHTLFWESMTPNGEGAPKGKLAEAINRDFSSTPEFIRLFSQATTTHFGSGWGWLSVDKEGMLHIHATPNQENGLMKQETATWTPLLGLDVWEHAYYLHYQNKRTTYVEAFWQVVNWAKVEERYQQATVSARN